MNEKRGIQGILGIRFNKLKPVRKNIEDIGLFFV